MRRLVFLLLACFAILGLSAWPYVKYWTPLRRVGKLAIGYVTNEHEQITWSIYARSVPCPTDLDRTLVLVPMGQSNAGSSIVGGHSSADDPRVTNFYAGSCYEAEDPLVGNGGIHGSVWPGLAAKLISNNSRWQHIVLAPMAVGGTPVARWSASGDLHQMAAERLEDLRAYGFRDVMFLWHQGESNNGSDPARYTAQLRELIDLTRRYFPRSAFLVSRASRCADRGPDRGLASAQAAVVDPQQAVFGGPDTDQLGEEFRRDRCHFNLQGQQAAIDRWLAAIREATVQSVALH